LTSLPSEISITDYKVLRKFEDRLKKDIQKRMKAYEIKYNIDWGLSLFNSSKEIEEERLKLLPIDERIRRYLEAEGSIIFEVAHMELFTLLSNRK
jgi:hypothetical protein